MSDKTIDEQFAALPDRVKGTLFGLLDAAAEVTRAGKLGEAGAVLEAAQASEIPESAKLMVGATEALLTALSLELHGKRLQWAADEGFESTEGFLAALRGGPFDKGGRHD